MRNAMLLGGSHDGKTVRVHDDVTSIRLPKGNKLSVSTVMSESVPAVFETEEYRRTGRAKFEALRRDATTSIVVQTYLELVD